jgi:hypothetical protein
LEVPDEKHSNCHFWEAGFCCALTFVYVESGFVMFGDRFRAKSEGLNGDEGWWKSMKP